MLKNIVSASQLLEDEKELGQRNGNTEFRVEESEMSLTLCYSVLSSEQIQRFEVT